MGKVGDGPNPELFVGGEPPEFVVGPEDFVVVGDRLPVLEEDGPEDRGVVWVMICPNGPKAFENPTDARSDPARALLSAWTVT